MNMRLVHSRSDESNVSDKERMMMTLRGLLRETCRLRNEGASYAKLAHAQGYADGYMKLLVDAGYMTDKELLGLIVEVRRGVDGPATCVVQAEADVLPA